MIKKYYHGTDRSHKFQILLYLYIKNSQLFYNVRKMISRANIIKSLAGGLVKGHASYNFLNCAKLYFIYVRERESLSWQ
jgi:hypothetical protein